MVVDLPAVPLGSNSESEKVSAFLTHSNGLGFSDGQTVSAIIGNRAINNGAAIDAFPCVEDEKEI
jgi:hypothetical protein